MFTAIGKFFSAMFKLVLGFFTGVFNWVRTHPRLAAEIVVGLMLVLATWHFASKYATTQAWAKANVIIDAQKVELERANAETALRDAKIDRIEKDAQEIAAALSTALEKARVETRKVVADYDRKLAIEKKKYRVITVNEPTTGMDIEVNVNPQGEVVCQRFPKTFMESVNEIIHNANKPLVLKPATGVER